MATQPRRGRFHKKNAPLPKAAVVPMLKLAEVQARLRMSREWIIKHIKGDLLPVLPAYWLGRTWHVELADLEKFIRELAAGGGEEQRYAAR